MSKRVVLGEIGSGQYGLRVSKPGTSVINADGTAVSVDNLSFDSLNPVSHLPLWRIYDLTVSGGTRDSATQIVTPGTRTQNFGTTLAAPPLAYIMWKESSSRYRSAYIQTARESPGYDNVSNSRQYLDDGFGVKVGKDQMEVQNYTTSSKSYRIILFEVGE